MTHRIALFLAGAIVALGVAGRADAASLGIATDAAPHYNSTGTLFSLISGFDFFGDSAAGTATGALAALSNIDIAFHAEVLPDGSIVPGASGLGVNDPVPPVLLSSTSLDGFGSIYNVGAPDILEFSFAAPTAGSTSGYFPNGALVTLTGEFGDNLNDTFALASAGIAGVSVNVAPVSGLAAVPLPAAGLLLLGGLGALALRRRKPGAATA